MSKTRFSVVQGNGGGAKGRAMATNFVLLEGGALFDTTSALQKSNKPTQLAFHGFRNDTHFIVSAGMYDIDFDDLRNLLKVYNITRIIDIRLSNSFDKNGFKPIKIKLLLKSLNVEYIHYKELANPFLGQIKDSKLLLVKYREYLWKERKADLANLMHHMKNGPLLLIGWSSGSGDYSERDVIIDAINKMDRDFVFEYEVIPSNQRKK